ncbi:MAG: DUF2807 domain-containing protein [Bacteroidales bacterium]
MKKEKMIRFVLFAVILINPAMLPAQMITEERAAEGFTGLKVSSVFEVYVTQGETFSVMVEAPEEHMEHIETIVENNMLSIDYTQRRVRNLEDLKVYVTAPEFYYLQASGASSIQTDDTLRNASLELRVTGASSIDVAVDVEELTTKVNGASRINLRGKAAMHDLTVSGVSRVNAYDLTTHTSYVKSSGTASARIRVTDTLSAEASGTSKVTFRGTPETTDYQTSGTGSIRGVDIDRTDNNETDDETTVIRIGDKELVFDSMAGRNLEIRDLEKSPATWRNNWSGFYLGINGYMMPDNSISLDEEVDYMDLEYNRSIQVDLNIWEQELVLARGNNGLLGLVSGIGFSWNNYRFSNNIKLVHGEDELRHYTDTIHELEKNKLTVSHMNVPLMLEFQHNPFGGSNFHAAAGINAGLRLRSHTKQVYQLEGERTKDKEYRDFHLVPFRYAAIARIGWGRINLFASYSLNSMFRDDKGPELYPFNVGIRIINF